MDRARRSSVQSMIWTFLCLFVLFVTVAASRPLHRAQKAHKFHKVPKERKTFTNSFFVDRGLFQPVAQQSGVFDFFVHDNLDTAGDTSAFTVVRQVGSINGAANTNLFGSIAVIDDSVTSGLDAASAEIGRGRGFYVFDSAQGGSSSLEFVFTLVFNEKSGFGGSTLTFKGNDLIQDATREIAITGGTGTFRMAKGWATITTAQANGGAANLHFVCNVFYGF